MKPSDDELLSFLSENAQWWEQTAHLFEETADDLEGRADAQNRATWNLLAAVHRERAHLCKAIFARIRGNSARSRAMKNGTAA